MAMEKKSRWCWHISDELLIEIFTRLPVKSLIRFRCVCRGWNKLITDHTFVSMHLANEKKRKSISCDHHNSCGGVLLNDKWSNKSSHPTLLTWFFSAPRHLYDFLKLSVGDTIDYRFPYGPVSDTIVEKISYSIVGYCDGLFCLSSRQLLHDRSPDKGNVIIALCNPATREIRVLPASNLDYPPYRLSGSVDIGFGFDPKTKDYKVVKVVTFSESCALDCFEVYSMTSDSWRMVFISKDNAAVQEITATSRCGATYTTNGVLHWSMLRCERDYVVVSFHMDDDSIRVTRLPESFYSPQQHRMHFSKYQCLSVLDGKPGLISTYINFQPPRFEGSEFEVDVFLLNRYELDDSSWSLVSSTVENQCGDIGAFGFWKSCVLVIHNFRSRYTSLYDIATRKSLELQRPGEMDFFYKESLVSVKRGPGTVTELS